MNFGILSAALLAQQPVQIDPQALHAELTRLCGAAERVSSETDEEKQTFVFAYPHYSVKFQDRITPVATFLSARSLTQHPEDYEPAFQQSWMWSDAREVVGKCRHQVVVSDMMAADLLPLRRIELFHKVLLALLSQGQYDAIHFVTSQQFVSAKDYPSRSAMSSLYGLLNVRMFNIGNGAPGEVVMDTMGMEPFGLPDTQCHYVMLEPNSIAPIVYNIAAYLLDKGDVIEDGHTVDGVFPGSKWTCQHEMAMVGPERPVLDINPGAPYAAGNRG